MSGMTMGEKLLARACGRDRVRPGDIVHPDPKLVILHDGFVVPAWRELDALGVTAPRHPERIVFVTDHEVAYATPAAATRGARIRETARDWRIGHFFDAGRGGHGHLFPMETGLVRPGDVLFAYDMHCQNFGAIGALAMRAGSEVIAVLATGTLWQEVPRSVRVTLHGTMRPGVMARDAGFRLAADLVAGVAPYDWRVIEFEGAATELPLAARVGLINTLTEIGVANVLFPPLDPLTGAPPSDAVLADADATYEAALEFDLGALTPQLARPGAQAVA
jgi:3-isopropylmalate/(R)-2-methylmalate dehydratase large subunit